MKVDIEIMNFCVPSSAQAGDEGSPMELSKLNWETLNKLCDNFRAGVFKNAKMKDSKGGL